MIKIYTMVNNRRTLVLGLSRENTTRLHAGQPIAVDVQAMASYSSNIDRDVQDVIVIAGESEQSMYAELSKYMPLPDLPDPGRERPL